MRISAIVATLDSAATLPACLDALREADEIIICDGGSADNTLAIARAAGARVIQAVPGRGAQLAAGARAARYGGLLFVSADTVLDPSAVWRARKHVNRSLRPACFRLRIDDTAWQARLVERAIGLSTRFLQLPSSAQALAVRRDRYLEAGGYRPDLAMEHADLIHRLAAVILLPDEAVTSPYRWREDGWLRHSLRNVASLALWHAGAGTRRIGAISRGREGRKRRSRSGGARQPSEGVSGF